MSDITRRNKVYLDLLLARKELAFYTKICMSPLPKKIYHTRKSHKVADWVAIKSKTPRETKFEKMNMLRIKAQLRLAKLEQDFSELLANYKEKNKGSIKGILDASRA